MSIRCYRCEVCGSMTKENDYDWKDKNLYLQLEKEGICEACVRGSKKAWCFGKMDLYITGNCAKCQFTQECWDKSFGDLI